MNYAEVLNFHTPAETTLWLDGREVHLAGVEFLQDKAVLVLRNKEVPDPYPLLLDRDGFVIADAKISRGKQMWPKQGFMFLRGGSICFLPFSSVAGAV